MNTLKTHLGVCESVCRARTARSAPRAQCDYWLGGTCQPAAARAREVASAEVTWLDMGTRQRVCAGVVTRASAGVAA